MGDFDVILARVPAGKRAALQSWWQGLPAEHRARGLADLEAKYPALPTAQVAVPATDAPLKPSYNVMAGAPPTLEAQGNGPRLPLPVPRGAAITGLLAAGNAIVPYADEAAAALTTGHVSGPEYETARRLAEYRIGQGANEHPTANAIGTGIGAGLGAGVLPSASPEVLASKGGGRYLARAAGEGALLGGLYSSGASDPGLANRIGNGAVGAGAGALGGLILGGAGAATGATRGTPAGRMALGVAEAGDADIGMAQARLRSADPSSPLMAADLLGPLGPSRVRAAAAVPGPGQRIVGEAFPARSASRPERFQNLLETELGTGGMNPYTASEGLLQFRQQEAEKAFTSALEPKGKPIVLPPAQTAPLLKIPRVRQLVDEYRAINTEAGTAQRPVQMQMPGMERVTGPELQYVKRRLAELGEGAEPGGAARTQAVGHRANSVQGAVERVLNNHVPGYREANAQYAKLSGLMEARDLGNKVLQTNPDLVEHTVGQFTPDQVRMMQLGIPSSASTAVESGSAATAMGKLGIGPGARLGRSRTMEAVLPSSVRPKFQQLAADEQLMLPAERAQNITSPTEPTRQSVVEAGLSGLSFGEAGFVRRELLRALRGGPNPEALARNAQMLTTGGTNRTGLENLLTEAVAARKGRGVNRSLGLALARLGAVEGPTANRTGTVQARALDAERLQEAQTYVDQLILQGATEDRAMELARTRYGLE